MSAPAAVLPLAQKVLVLADWPPPVLVHHPAVKEPLQVPKSLV